MPHLPSERNFAKIFPPRRKAPRCLPQRGRLWKVGPTIVRRKAPVKAQTEEKSRGRPFLPICRSCNSCLSRFRPFSKNRGEKMGGRSYYPFRRIQRSIAFSGSRRKSERESMRMPCSLYPERMGRFTMTILRKASLMESSDVCSCCIFSSEGISYADWI